MAAKTAKRIVSDRVIRKNKAVSRTVIEDAERLSRELEAMGVKRKSGYRLAHPLDSKQVMSQSGESGRIGAQSS